METPPGQVIAATTSAIERAAELLATGGLVAFPTETVYGLGADATSPAAVARVFAAKGRPPSDPLIVHVTGVAQAEAFGDLDVGRGDARRLAAELWPGPLTVVVPRRGPLAPAVGGGGDTVGLRAPAHPVALQLIDLARTPLAAPSANRFGRVSPTCAADVVAELGAEVDLVLDAGATPLGVESTVVAVSPGGAAPRLLRPGGVTVEALREVVADLEVPERLVAAADAPAPGPGTMPGHYAPEVPLTLVEDPAAMAPLVAALGEAGVRVAVLELPAVPAAAAAVLYRRLRALHPADTDAALVAVGDPAGLGRAVNDRLFRAAHGHVATDATEATVRRLAARAALGRSGGGIGTLQQAKAVAGPPPAEHEGQ